MRRITTTVAVCLVGAMLSVLAVLARALGVSYTDEAAYMAALAAAGAGTFREGFEDALTWGGTRSSPVPLSVTSQGINWTSNNSISRISTGLVGTRTGTGTLIGVGGWVRAGTAGAEVGFVLTSGAVSTAYGFTDATLTSAHKFFGVIDEEGFETFEVFETEGRVEDQQSIFADDFTFGRIGLGANQVPMADAGPDQSIAVGATATPRATWTAIR